MRQLARCAMGSLVCGGVLSITSAAAASTTNTLNWADARQSIQAGGNISIGSAHGRSDVATITSSASIWGSAALDFGMPGSGNAGVGGWAGANGALLSDISGVSFDWYRADGGLGGGFRVSMYVYAPTATGDISGYLQFDLSGQLPSQVGGQWNSSGNMLAGAAGSAWYSADYGSSQYAGYKTWAEIQTALAGWSVYEIGIINDAGYTASVSNFAVTFVPTPGALALLGAAGLVARRRKS
jgi:MYXO-CTERM domain-containing protein